MGQQQRDREWQKARRLKLREQGLCTGCGKREPTLGFTRCEVCRQQSAANTKKHRMSCYAKRKASSLCTECGRKPSVGGVLCEQCRERLREQKKEQIAKGICVNCTLPALPDRRRCQICTDAQKRQRREKRLKVFDAYGGSRCNCCGESNLKFLTIDHVNNDGKEHRKTVKASLIFHWIIKNNYPPGFQVLCFNCNLGRQFNGGVCPHNDPSVA